MINANEIVKRIREKDAFIKWLGIELLELKEGFCKLACKR